MYNKIASLLAVLALVFVAATGFSAPLEQILNEVLSTHPTVMEKLKNYNSTVHDYRRSARSFNPTLDFDAEFGQQQIKNSSTSYSYRKSDVHSMRLVGRQLISDGSRSRFDSSAREAFAKAALFSYFETANLIAMETVEAYVNMLKSYELARLAQENVAIHRQIMEAIRTRVEAGSSGKAELERVQGRLAAAQSTLIVRQNDYRRSTYNLHKYLGRFVHGSELVLPNLDESVIPHALSDALVRMRAEHPTLLAADYNIEQRHLEHSRDKADYNPYVFLEASRNLRDNYSGVRGSDGEYNLMVKLNYRLVDGGERRDTTRRAKSVVHRERQAKNRVLRALNNGIQLSWSGYRLLEQQIGAIRKSILFTRQALNSYKEEFRLGKRLMINILDAEGELQNLKALFANVKYDMLVSKYRILFSLGTLPKDLGIEIPYQNELLEARRLRPSDNDDLPLDLDTDIDGIAIDFDISPNSLPNSVVNEFGEIDRFADYISEPYVIAQTQEQVVVTSNQQLRQDKISLNVPTKIDFVSFLPDSKELSLDSKILMRDIIEQLKNMSSQGLIRIEVVTGEKNHAHDNYSLGLKRAYAIKKILMAHRIDAEGIEVISIPSDSSDAESHANHLIFTVVSDPVNFFSGIETVLLTEARFTKGSIELDDVTREEIKRLATRIVTREKVALDIIVYSNDAVDAPANERISFERAKALKDLFVNKGIKESDITEIGWGHYQAEYDLYAMGTAPQNQVKIVIRD